MQVLCLLIPRNSNDACCLCFKASFFLLCDALPSVLFLSCFHFLTIIGGMGFGQGMTSICRGKAAYQSTLAVIFGRTFSGLQGAVRLHKLYAESKHGRTKFQKIGPHGSLQTHGVPSNTKENVLYCYLGISIDLDKLYFQTEKRCVVKSKEIKAVAVFSQNTE